MKERRASQILERDVSEGGLVVEEGERRAVLWDCKREALRGLGVNIGEEKQLATPTRLRTKVANSIMERKFQQIQTLGSTTDSTAIDYCRTRGSNKNPNITLSLEKVITLRRFYCYLS